MLEYKLTTLNIPNKNPINFQQERWLSFYNNCSFQLKVTGQQFIVLEWGKKVYQLHNLKPINCGIYLSSL